MTNDIGLFMMILIICDIIFDLMHPTIMHFQLTLALWMHLGMVSAVANQFGSFHWNCLFCGKPGMGTFIEMIMDVCNHEGN